MCLQICNINVVSYRQILLVGEDQKKSIPQLVFVQHALQFFTSLNDTIAIVAVHHENDALRVLEVMPPQRSNLILSTHIPHCERDILVFNCLNVEAWKEEQLANFVAKDAGFK